MWDLFWIVSDFVSRTINPWTVAGNPWRRAVLEMVNYPKARFVTQVSYFLSCYRLEPVRGSTFLTYLDAPLLLELSWIQIRDSK